MKLRVLTKLNSAVPTPYCLLHTGEIGGWGASCLFGEEVVQNFLTA